MLTVLCDAGIGSGVMSVGGRCWQDRDRLGGVLASGMRLRLRLASVGVVIAFPALYFLLQRQGASVGLSLLLCASVVPVFLATLTGQLREVIIKLHQKLVFLQTVQLSSALIRLLLLLAILNLYPQSWLAVLVAGLSQWVASYLCFIGSSKLINYHGREDPEADKELRGYVKKTLPGAFYYAFSGQVSVWVISIFGSIEAVAKVGVVGRIAMICSILNSIFSILVLPRFACMPADGRRLLRAFIISLSAVLGLGLLILLVLSVFPGLVVFLVGSTYGGMQKEIFWGVIAAVLAMAGGIAYGLGAVRGIIMKPQYSIGIAFLSNVFLIAVSDLGTASGVLRMNAFYGLIVLIMYTFYVGFRVSKPSMNAASVG